MIEKVQYILNMRDAYGPLLTNKQNDVLVRYFEDDLSLAEIGEQMGISKQAVFDLIKRTVQLLEQYEKKLQIIQRNQDNTDRLYRIMAILSQDHPENSQLQIAQQLIGDILESY